MRTKAVGYPPKAVIVVLLNSESVGRVELADGEETAGYRTWRDYRWTAQRAGPFQTWMLALKSNHL
ncbi:hypothetical protein [Algihabitans sp.]|uniref:hypothetical protein n=1 Tax=Algihabitans sp. TaxID=2821514 RepID=UPI003BA8F7AE